MLTLITLKSIPNEFLNSIRDLVYCLGYILKQDGNNKNNLNKKNCVAFINGSLYVLMIDDFNLVTSNITYF